MVQKENLAIFESSSISETGEATPTKIGINACYINAYLHKLFEPILIDSIFWPPWTIVHGPKGNFGRFEGKQKGAKSPKLERPHQPKLVSMHCMKFLSRFYFLTQMDYIVYWTKRNRKTKEHKMKQHKIMIMTLHKRKTQKLKLKEKT